MLVVAATAFGFGFRHGVDWDHIAALTDITGSQETPRRSMGLATLYALGHALVVFGLGFAAIVLAEQLPAGVDAVMERVVGATLLLLGVYVFTSLARHGRDFRMRSRWMLVFAGVRRFTRRLRQAARPGRHELVVVEHDHHHDHAGDVHHHVGPAQIEAAGARRATTTLATTHRHGHRHVGSLPDDPFMDYGRATAFGVGMLHGIGAETPTQVLIFVTAAGVGGKASGMLLLACFLAGLLASNSLVALAGAFGFVRATRHFPVYAAVSVLTATFSLVIGALFLFGQSTTLPALLGG